MACGSDLPIFEGDVYTYLHTGALMYVQTHRRVYGHVYGHV